MARTYRLICPFDSKRLNVGAGYQTLADNIKKFHELRLMHDGIYVCIDEGSVIAQSFTEHKACLHKSCNLKLNRTKLNRAEKRTSHERIDDIATTSKKKTRHSFSVMFTSNPSVCVFCNEHDQEALQVFNVWTRYTERIRCLGADVSSRVNSYRLKDRIVSNFSDLDAYKQGRENILAFKDDIGPAWKRVCLEDFDNEFVNISKAATFVRRDIFALNSEFRGTFLRNAQSFYTPVIASFGQYDSVWTQHSGSFIFSADINKRTASDV
ncbi:unnamed protein product [Mytilus coruscus]|uniref:Uncharacterized protein n=1 Tax=Mytilus coruscus TaxID=42192 RepID=A0A6J8E1R0_MYTCO|nr:unnamed protein product [Mytilus coruscus]